MNIFVLHMKQALSHWGPWLKEDLENYTDMIQGLNNEIQVYLGFCFAQMYSLTDGERRALCEDCNA